MTDRWVNAEITFVIPLEVSPDASDTEKRDAAIDCFEKHFSDVADEHVATIRAETVSDQAEEGERWSLRSSQVDVLKTVSDAGGASPLSVAARLKRGERSVEQSLIRLMVLGYLSRSSQPLRASVYSLTDKGRGELQRGGGQ